MCVSTKFSCNKRKSQLEQSNNQCKNKSNNISDLVKIQLVKFIILRISLHFLSY